MTSDLILEFFLGATAAACANWPLALGLLVAAAMAARLVNGRGHEELEPVPDRGGNGSGPYPGSSSMAYKGTRLDPLLLPWVLRLALPVLAGAAAWFLLKYGGLLK